MVSERLPVWYWQNSGRAAATEPGTRQMVRPLIGEQKSRPGLFVSSKGRIFRAVGNNDNNTQSVVPDAH